MIDRRSKPRNNSQRKSSSVRMRYCTLAISLVIFNHPVFSCSMDMKTASELVIQEIIKFIQHENKRSDLEITKIEKVHGKKFPYWTYIVESAGKSSHCQAEGYKVNIDPGCNVKVERLNQRFVCQ
jgi:hypothetical protein